MGGWLAHELRRVWRDADGKDMEWDEMYRLAQKAPAFAALIDPDDPGLYNPPNMEKALLAYTQNRRSAVARVGAETPGSRTPDAIPGTGAGVSAMIPQFGDSFLDRIVEMTTQSDDMKFRQEFTERITTEALAAVEYTGELQFYEDMFKTMQGHAPVTPGITPEQQAADIKTIKEWFATVYGELVKITGQIQSIYDELSGKNLNPRTELYSAPEPMEIGGGLRLRKRAGYWAGMVIVAMLAVAAGCLLHDRLSSGKAAASEPPF